MINRLYDEHQVLIELLSKAGELSLVNSVDSSFRKSLLLSAASFFEVCLRDCLLGFFSERAGGDEAVVSFLKNKAIERQYHTYFNWRERKANQFFGLFGSGFRDFMVAEVRKDGNLDNSIQAFLELGEMRNLLVHQDFAAFPLEKTVGEIFELYQRAEYFVNELPRKLRSYTSAKTGDKKPGPA